MNNDPYDFSFNKSNHHQPNKINLQQKSPKGPYPETSLPFAPFSRDKSYIRYANYSPPFTSLNIYLDHRLVVRNLMFGEHSQYYVVNPGQHLISIYDYNNPSAPIFAQSIELLGGAFISTVVVNFIAQINLQLLNDNVFIPENTFLIKFGNLSPNAPALDLIINNQLIFSNIAFPNVTHYALVPQSKNYDVQINITKTDFMILSVPNIIFLPNNAYTINGIGLYKGEPPLQIDTTLDGSSFFVD